MTRSAPCVHRHSLPESAVPARHWGWWWGAHSSWPLHGDGWNLSEGWRGFWVEGKCQVLLDPHDINIASKLSHDLHVIAQSSDWMDSRGHDPTHTNEWLGCECNVCVAITLIAFHWCNCERGISLIIVDVAEGMEFIYQVNYGPQLKWQIRHILFIVIPCWEAIRKGSKWVKLRKRVRDIRAKCEAEMDPECECCYCS